MTLRVSVIGTGYLGATHAAGMAEVGHQVVGIDVDPERIAVLAAGRSPIFEDGLEPLLARHTRSGRLRFTTDYRVIADWADVHFLALGTPAGPDGAADLQPAGGGDRQPRAAAHPTDPGGRQVDRPGRHGPAAPGAAARPGSGR